MIRFVRRVIRVVQVPTYQHLASELRMPYVHLAEFVVRGIAYLPHATVLRIPYVKFKNYKVKENRCRRINQKKNLSPSEVPLSSF